MHKDDFFYEYSIAYCIVYSMEFADKYIFRFLVIHFSFKQMFCLLLFLWFTPFNIHFRTLSRWSFSGGGSREVGKCGDGEYAELCSIRLCNCCLIFPACLAAVERAGEPALHTDSPQPFLAHVWIQNNTKKYWSDLRLNKWMTVCVFAFCIMSYLFEDEYHRGH